MTELTGIISIKADSYLHSLCILYVSFFLYIYFSVPPIQQPLPPRFPGGLITKASTPGFEIIPVPGAPGSGTGVMGNPFQQMLGGLPPLPAYHGMNINPANLLQQSKTGQCMWFVFFYFAILLILYCYFFSSAFKFFYLFYIYFPNILFIF